ncbi:MAG TPA: hypothetical protein V6C86_08380 [Oculatellaceae cyanobacterium]
MKAAKLNEELLDQYIQAGCGRANPEQLRVLAALAFTIVETEEVLSL